MNNKTFTTKCSMLALLLLLLSQNAFAQREAYNWYFGFGGKMTWNETQTIVDNGKTLTGLPKPLAGGSAATSQNEGVFNMSDTDGNLLFYSDGMTIWNRDHQTMEGGSGLLGHRSSAQSGIIIPYPEQDDKFIAFSVATNTLVQGIPNFNMIGYSVIDMNLQGGLGEVTTKNVLLTGHNGVLGESASAVKHSNGVDYWFIAVGKGVGVNSALNVWKITPAGMDPVCVDSYPLTTNTSPIATANGYLRFSVDGKYFAWTESVGNASIGGNGNMLHFGEFDPSTGTFPTIKSMNLGFEAYGVEFSPYTELLYVARTLTPNNNDHIYCYKFADLLTAQNPPTGVAYHTMSTGKPTFTNIGSLQLGPDMRIYAPMWYSSEMIVIDNTNDFDNATCHVLSGLMAGQGALGLPNFMSHIFIPVSGAIGSNQIIYNGNTPAQLTSISDASCSGEVITYLWEQSTDSLTWTAATGTNNLNTYQPPALTTTTYYHRRAASDSCGITISNVLKITIADDLSAGAIADSQSIDYGNTPAALTSTAPASGGIGTITYQWQSSTDGTNWADISGATAQTYAPGALTATTYYRRAASDDNFTVYTGSVQITVAATSNMITVSATDTEVCSGDPTTLSAIASLVISPVFRWYSAATGGTPLGTAPTFTPSPNLTETTTFHVSVSGNGLAESTRKAITITVTPRSSSSMIKFQ